MYHAHFGFREEPFGVSPDDRFYFPTEHHREALASLYYAIRQRRGFALLVGRAGLGKTSLVRQLLKLLEGEAKTAYLPYPYFDHTTLLESILATFGLQAAASVSENYRNFYEYLIKIHRGGQTCAVVFDEAQELNRETLESVRMLSNFEIPSGKLIQIVLAGQPRLAETLAQRDFEQLRQRLNGIARLRPMNRAESSDYIGFRLRAAGASTNPFTADALDDIADASGGVPRNVNTICFNSLTLAYALSHDRVQPENVAEVVNDLDLIMAEYRNCA